MRRDILKVFLLAVICCGGVVWACPSADANGDCRVDLEDLAMVASQWLTDRSSAFVTTWDTNLSEGTTVTLALAGSVDATIDWGDGTVEAVTTPGPHVHDYGSDGVYTVFVTGTVTAYNSAVNGGVSYSEQVKLVSVDHWGQVGFTSMHSAFNRCPNLTSVPNTTDGLEAVTDMRGMFSETSSFNADISGWDTSAVTDMSRMFWEASSFNRDISGWDTSNVTDMSYMFYHATSFNQNIGGWDVSGVTNMDAMFSGAESFNQDLTGWCVVNITSQPPSFDYHTYEWNYLWRPKWGVCGHSFMTTWDTSLGTGTTVTLGLAGTVDATIDWRDGTITDVNAPGPHVHDYGSDGVYSVFVTGTVTAYNSLDHGGSTSERAKLISVNNWGRVGFTSMHNAFNYCTNLVSVPSDIDDDDLDAVTDMSRMFMLASSFNKTLIYWNTSNVTDMSAMFYGASSFNQPIDTWDTSNVTSMYWMFYGASSFNVYLTLWDTSRVEDMNLMFANATAFNGDISTWDTSSVTNMNGMFKNASSFDKDLSGWCVTSLITSPPTDFDTGTTVSWEEAEKPVWGTCPP
jgi:surface protein